MGLFIKLAIRNVHRNLKSTFLNGIGITLSVISLLFILSLSRGIESQIVSRNIRFDTGALSITIDKKTASFKNKEAGDILFSELSSFLDKHPLVTNYFPRIYLPKSSLYFNDNSQSVSTIGLSKQEIPLIGEMLEITEGDIETTQSGIIISNAIAEQYHITPGDNCHLMTQTVDGSMNLDEFIVKGIFRYTSQGNKFTVYMDYEDARSLYHTNLPSRIFINTDNLGEVTGIKQEIRTIIEQEGVETTSYLDHMGSARSISTINKYGMLGVAVFLILISFIGIWSMQTENINERQREIGSLLSFGFKTGAVKKTFLYESVYISLLFFTMGFFITGGSILFINLQNGIYLGESASFAFGSAIINPVLTVKQVLTVLGVTILYPFVATAFSLQTVSNRSIINLLHN